jgi:hypothetical protein
MSALTYSIENLLEGTYYRSMDRGLEGTITHAEKRDSVYYGKNCEAYLVTVRPTFQSGTPIVKDFYATIAVKVGE